MKPLASFMSVNYTHDYQKRPKFFKVWRTIFMHTSQRFHENMHALEGAASMIIYGPYMIIYGPNMIISGPYMIMLAVPSSACMFSSKRWEVCIKMVLQSKDNFGLFW